MKRIIQSKKVITMMVVSLLATITIYSAAPLVIVAGTWASYGEKAFRLLEVGGTFITWGQVAAWLDQPDDVNDRIIIRPHLTERWTYEENGVDHGEPSWGHLQEASDFSSYDPVNGMTPHGGASLGQPWFDIGNYAHTEIDYFKVVLDGETGDYYKGDSLSYAKPVWFSKSTWDFMLNNPLAAQKKDDWWNWFFYDTWTQPGYWITYGRSKRGIYPNVFVESKFVQGGVNDGELKNKAEEEDLQYKATILFQLNAVTWVPDINFPNNGSWYKNGWFSFKRDLTFPAYKYDFESPNICPENSLIRNVDVKGGKEYWWHTNMDKSLITVEETPVTNLTGNNTVLNLSLVTTKTWVKKTYTTVLEDNQL